MSARKGPPVGHYAPVDIANVDKFFNIGIRDLEKGASKLAELMDKYPNGVPIRKLQWLVEFLFEIGLKLEGSKSRILDEAQCCDSEDEVTDDDDHGAGDGPAPEGCAGEGGADILQNNKKNNN